MFWVGMGVIYNFRLVPLMEEMTSMSEPASLRIGRKVLWVRCLT